MLKQLCVATISVPVLTLALGSAAGQTRTNHGDDYIMRQGSKLTLSGLSFRYSGPNLEWLGLEGYGPFSKDGPHYPTSFEIEDAFATAPPVAGAVTYSIQQHAPGSTDWKTIWDKCARDTDDPWVNPQGPVFGARYRVIAWNADGVPSEPSSPW